MTYRERRALVTGSSGGIGAALARELAARGSHLVLVARSTDKLDALARELRERHPGIEVDVITADLSRAEAGREIHDQLARADTRIDILVNNAGAGAHGDVEDADPDRLAREIQLDVGTLVDLTTRLLPPMLRRDTGVILNVASTAAFQPVPSMAVYGASKAFVLSFTEALWGETRRTGVRVLALCPGSTQTGFFADSGAEFLTHNRQTPEAVAETAMQALDGTTPTVVSGTLNRLNAEAYRVFPRRWMIRVSQFKVRAR